MRALHLRQASIYLGTSAGALTLHIATHVPAGPELMQLEPHDAVEKLRLTLKVLGALKSYFFEYKGGCAASSCWICPGTSLSAQGGLDGSCVCACGLVGAECLQM